MNYNSEQIKDMLQAIENTGYIPNEWEQNFIDSIKEGKRNLSKKQSDCLNKIYDKASGDGGFVTRQRF